MKIASFDKRLVAWIIDYIFYLLLAIGLDVFMEFFVIRIANFNAIFFLANIFVAHFVFFFIFNSLMMFLSKGQTLGTLIKKIKTVHRDESKFTILDSLCKNLCISLLPIVIVNAIYMLAKHTEITIFDNLTETIVISKEVD